MYWPACTSRDAADGFRHVWPFASPGPHAASGLADLFPAGSAFERRWRTRSMPGRLTPAAELVLRHSLLRGLKEPQAQQCRSPVSVAFLRTKILLPRRLPGSWTGLRVAPLQRKSPLRAQRCAKDSRPNLSSLWTIRRHPVRFTRDWNRSRGA